MIVALPFSDAFSPFSSIFLKVDLFNCKTEIRHFVELLFHFHTGILKKQLNFILKK